MLIIISALHRQKSLQKRLQRLFRFQTKFDKKRFAETIFFILLQRLSDVKLFINDGQVYAEIAQLVEHDLAKVGV
ncbi:hypothetical protein, partial [Anaerophaga thermohalophila]|uniref:hypothetical protein n=1 Tax=Anaerophaga thermohalophila TaxID=177400 RepID=UPI001B7F93FE